MRSFFFYSFILVGALVLLLIGVQILKVQTAIKKLSYDNKPFLRNNPKAVVRILFVGDSTALGTGAKNNNQSVAGWFGRDYPRAHIDNRSANGKKLGGLVQEFNPSKEIQYSLVVIQIGANDIFRFSRFPDIERNLTTVIKRAKTISKNIIILHSGNVGLAPVFIWPFDRILSARARQMRALYMKKAKEQNILYVDLFTERSNDLFLKDIKTYYSADSLHPSGEGYKWWYQRIRWTLDQAGVVLSS